MKREGSTLFAVAVWLYFIIAIILYVYFDVAWVKTFDLVLNLLLLFGLSAWYVTDRILYGNSPRPRTSRWLIGPWGITYRRRPPECPPSDPNRN